jgi:hypothetical protein
MFRAIIAGLVTLIFTATPGAVAQVQRTDVPTEDAAALRKPFERFEGTVALRTKDGKVKQLQVVARNWIIDNRRNIASFPDKGFMIVELRGGELTTVIDGKRQKRKEGEFWTVPAGSSMGVETDNDSAVIQTFAVKESAR